MSDVVQERAENLRDKCAAIVEVQKQVLVMIEQMIGLEPEKNAADEVPQDSLSQLLIFLNVIDGNMRYISRKIQEIETKI